MEMKMRGGELLLLCCLLFSGNPNFTGLASPQTAHLSAYQLTMPRPITGRLKRALNGSLADRLSLSLTVDGRELVVHLQKNQMLLPADFTVYSYSPQGSLRSTAPPAKDHCHYRGHVEDEEGSSVAVSICNGLRGVLHLRDNSYGIEPLDSASEQHLVYRLQDVTSQPQGCGTLSYTHNLNGTEQDWIGHRRHHRTRRAVLLQTHYVELFLVVDNERFNYMNRNESAVTEEMVQLANYIDSMYVQLNVRVVLVGLEIWSQQNLISTEGSAGDVLSRFTQWRERELVTRRRHDSAQFILRKSFGGTAGMAFVSTVCSRSHGGGINAFTNNNVPAFASIVAHELGHNLGMNHDDERDCSCPVAACIMNSGATGSRKFSSCSADDFEKMVLHTGGTCLLNVPRPDDAYSAPFCGNKLVDMGEECDCGSEKECEQDPCCEYQTCKMKSGAQCAYGECCKHCQFLSAGSVCRRSLDECDLPEYCNGSSPFCQSDVFAQNGQLCRRQQAYCYNGKCQHHEEQCRALFGPNAKVAPDICFKDVNSKGDRFGNCGGFQNYGYKKCESRNALCGKLQCSGVEETTVFGRAAIITSPIGGTVCIGVDFMLGSDVPDPGMVNEGTKCGENKVCVNFECCSAEVLNYDCDTEKKCHGHGVCNSNRNCHCDSGWAPPFCEVKGYGGSLDSGPTWNEKDTSVRDGLLVLFLLVLPLLVLASFVYLRRNQLPLMQRLSRGRHKRSQGYQPDGNAAPNPSRGPPPRAPPPTAYSRSNANNIVKEGVVETNRRPPPNTLRPPPPPLKPKPAVAQPLVPQRPAPAPPM